MIRLLFALVALGAGSLAVIAAVIALSARDLADELDDDADRFTGI